MIVNDSPNSVKSSLSNSSGLFTIEKLKDIKKYILEFKAYLRDINS